MMEHDDQAQIDRVQLEELCQHREVNRRQRRIDDIIMKRKEIERNVSVPSEDAWRLRPYGLPWEERGAAEHVWDYILKRVTDPRSIKNLCEVCQMFQRLLRRKYVESTLPEIVSLIHSKRMKYLLPESFEEDIENYDHHRDGGLEYFNGLKRQRNFDLRLVSRQCKLSEESFWDFRLVLSPIDIEELRLMIETIKGTTFQPDQFISGTVAIQDDEIADIAVEGEFYDMVIVFLGLIGKRIRNLKYFAFHSSARVVYDHLRKWVCLMPNLVRISLYYWGDEETNRENVEEIEQFPLCPSLRKYIEPYMAFPVPFVQQILEANPSITKLFVKTLPSQGLDKLVNLTFLETCMDLSLLGHRHLNWNLNRLILKPSARFYGQQMQKEIVSSRDLFQFLERFGNTLEHLELMIDVINCVGEYLRLPNLKTLKWQHHESFQDINFLLHAEKLETLQVIVAEGLANESALSLYMEYGRIVGSGCVSFLGKSAWEVFPYLKWIRVVRTHDYQRSGGCIFQECRAEIA